MQMREFTLRALLLGLVMTVILGAANAYLGLRAGITIAALVPGLEPLDEHQTDLDLSDNNAQSATSVPEFHTFWPLTTHSSPSGAARVCTLARSEPAPGSEKNWAQCCSP